jgi:transcriptional regulator with XRE-family HTH domain
MADTRDPYVLARMIRERREAKNLNVRELAEIVSRKGGKATTQAVQQWENTDPAQRTTRPGMENLMALSEILGIPFSQLRETAESLRIKAIRDGEPRLHPHRRPSGPIFEMEVRRYLRDALPATESYFEREISPFGVKRRFDYLSPRLALEIKTVWSGSKIADIDGALWQLTWLQRFDKSMAVSRKYMLMFIAPESETPDLFPDEKTNMMLTAVKDELRLFGDFIHVEVVSDPQSAAAIIISNDR